jgi:hypothetical protein
MQLLNGPRAHARAGLAHLLGRSPAATAAPAAPAAVAEDPDAEEEAEEEQAEGEPKPEATDDETASETAAEEEDEAAMEKGAKAERARIGAILNSDAARANMPAALELALGTDLPAAQATALLGKLSGTRAGLGSRMASQPSPALGDTPGTEGSNQQPDLAAAARKQAEANHAIVRRLRGETA